MFDGLIRVTELAADFDESGESPSADAGALFGASGTWPEDMRDCRRVRFGATCIGRVWGSPCTGGFGGAAAIGTTPGFPPVVPVKLVGVVTAEPEWPEPCTEPGDAEL